MKQSILTISLLVVVTTFFCSCAGKENKKEKGNLSIEIYSDEADPNELMHVDFYIDDKFIGNPTDKRPFIMLDEGVKRIKIEGKNFQTYEREIHIVGGKSSQALVVKLERPKTEQVRVDNPSNAQE